jgi:hypothetical protein
MPGAEALSPDVLAMLGKETGIDSKEVWTNIFTLISKSEHDNEDPKRAFLTDKGESVFSYAAFLKSDWKQRGCTLGLMGFTTANDHKDGEGDALPLFARYKELGGPDLSPLAKGCCKDEKTHEPMIKAIKKAGEDPKFVYAQWRQLFEKDGYICETMKAWKKLGIDRPSALAVAVVFDTSLNVGCQGPYGGCKFLVKLGTKGNEAQTLKDYCAWKTKISGKNAYNDPPSNGHARGQMFADLVEAKCFSLVDCDKQLKKALSWKMR